MYCAHCGHPESSADEQFCDECGTVLCIAVSEPPQQVAVIKPLAESPPPKLPPSRLLQPASSAPAPPPAAEAASGGARGVPRRAVEVPRRDPQAMQQRRSVSEGNRLRQRETSNILAYIVMSLLLALGGAWIWRMYHKAPQAQTEIVHSTSTKPKHKAALGKPTKSESDYLSRRQDAINLALHEEYDKAIPKLLTSWKTKSDYQVAFYLFTSYRETESRPQRGSNADQWARRVIAMGPGAITTRAARQYIASVNHPSSGQPSTEAPPAGVEPQQSHTAPPASSYTDPDVARKKEEAIRHAHEPPPPTRPKQVEYTPPPPPPPWNPNTSNPPGWNPPAWNPPAWNPGH